MGFATPHKLSIQFDFGPQGETGQSPRLYDVFVIPKLIITSTEGLEAFGRDSKLELLYYAWPEPVNLS